MGWQPPYQSEGRIYAKYLLKEKPDAKIAVMYQNDDFGKDLLKGLKDGLGDKAASMIVAEESYEVSEPTIDSPHRQAEGLRRRRLFQHDHAEIRRPEHQEGRRDRLEADVLPEPMSAPRSARVLQPAGFENAQGILSAAYAKDGADPQWDNDQGMKKFYAFLAKYAPDANKADGSVVFGYGQAQTMVQVLEAGAATI